MIEAGSKDSSPVVKLPSGTSVKGIKRFDWGYQTSPDPARNGLDENWIRGRVVGGSSSINGMNYERGNAADFDRWEAMGNPGWGAKEVMPFFRSLENSDQ